MSRDGALDLGRLLGLTGPGAWALAGLYVATYLMFGLTAGLRVTSTAPGAVALALTLVAAVALVLPGPHPIPLPLVAAVIATVAFTTAAIMWQLSPIGWPGWPAWIIGANTFLLFTVALRGRIVAGGVGMLVMTAVVVHWTWSTTGDVMHGLSLTYWQLASYAAGAFYAALLRRTGRQILAFHEAERRVAAEEDARRAADEERAALLGRVHRVAGASLAAIASGETDAVARREHGLLEAALRDQIRGRALSDGPVPAAARAARRRGVTIALLDDLREGSELELAEARAWVAARLSRARGGEVTVRLAIADGRPVVTVADEGLTTFDVASGQTVD